MSNNTANILRKPFSSINFRDLSLYNPDHDLTEIALIEYFIFKCSTNRGEWFHTGSAIYKETRVGENKQRKLFAKFISEGWLSYGAKRQACNTRHFTVDFAKVATEEFLKLHFDMSASDEQLNFIRATLNELKLLQESGFVKRLDNDESSDAYERQESNIGVTSEAGAPRKVGSSKPKGKTIDERKSRFENHLSQWIKDNPKQYSESFYIHFRTYWMTLNESGTRMMFEDDKYFFGHLQSKLYTSYKYWQKDDKYESRKNEKQVVLITATDLSGEEVTDSYSDQQSSYLPTIHINLAD